MRHCFAHASHAEYQITGEGNRNSGNQRSNACYGQAYTGKESFMDGAKLEFNQKNKVCLTLEEITR